MLFESRLIQAIHKNSNTLYLDAIGTFATVITKNATFKKTELYLNVKLNLY